MVFPSSLSVWGMQARVGLPSIRTVQVPQAPSLPSFPLGEPQELLILFDSHGLAVYGKSRHIDLLGCRAQRWSHGLLDFQERSTFPALFIIQ